MSLRTPIIIALLLLQWSCLNIKVVTIGQKTALERQLIGTHEELDRELALLSSVRGINLNQQDESTITPMQQKALDARRRQRFNRDDVDELKSWGCLIETSQAVLIPRNCPQVDHDSKIQERQAYIIQEENQDRNTIIEYVIAQDPQLSPGDKAKVAALYFQLLTETSQPGTWIKNKDGSLTQKN